jgi:predicted permease
MSHFPGSRLPGPRSSGPEWLRVVRAKLVALLRRDRLDDDFEQELASHLAMAADDHRRRGLSADQARRAALLNLGGLEATRLLHRDTRGVPLMDTILHDLRYTARTLRRDAGFAAVAVLILGIGIGANTAIFSLVNALLLRPLPFPDADRLVWIPNSGSTPVAGASRPSSGSSSDGRRQGGLAGTPANLSGTTTRALNFQEWKTRAKSFESMGAYFAFYNYGSARLTVGTETERLVDVGVTCTFFRTLGVEPVLGRQFLDEECIDNGPRAALISHRLWERRFRSDPTIVGRAITLNQMPVTVAGVMPASFDFGAVFAPGSRVDVWSPFPIDQTHDGWGNTLSIVGRLKPGVSIETAQAELDTITRDFQRANPNRGQFGAGVAGLQSHVSGRLRTALIVLFSAVGAVLLIACANLSNLLLARAASRQQEIAVRTALGATRSRLIRQLLTESLVLSLCGAVLGLGLAVAATRGVTRLSGLSLPLLQTVDVDGRALAFTIGMALVTGLLFGLAPALQISRARPQEALKQQARGSSGSARAAFVRRALVVAEVAMACVLLVTAGLLIRSFVHVLDVNLGFQPERIAVLRVEPGQGITTPPQRNAFYDEVVRRIEAVPGIESAGLTDALPLDRNRTWDIQPQGVVYPPGTGPSVFVRVVSRGYFETMGIPMRAGTDFTGQETRDTEPVLILNETAARAFWPDQNPIGRIARTNGTDYRVIGVVADVRHTALEENSGNEMYLPLTRVGPAGSADLVMRTALAPSALSSSIRSALGSVDPTLPTTDIRPMQDLVDKAVSPRRFVVWLLGAFAVQALILACLGIYGVVSYSVTERTREIGIRMALGASRGDVQRRVLRETLTLAVVGAVLGLVGAFAAGRIVNSLLYGLTATDPATFFGMIGILTMVALFAGYLPARRASRIDAMTALRAS